MAEEWLSAARGLGVFVFWNQTKAFYGQVSCLLVPQPSEKFVQLYTAAEGV